MLGPEDQPATLSFQSAFKSGPNIFMWICDHLRSWVAHLRNYTIEMWSLVKIIKVNIQWKTGFTRPIYHREAFLVKARQLGAFNMSVG